MWGSDWYGDEHIVDVHVGHLRKKLDDDASIAPFHPDGPRRRLRDGVVKPRSLAARLFTAQLLVIAITFMALLVTVVLIAPGLFLHHLRMTGEDSPVVQLHAQQAFETSVGLALLAAAAVAIVAAILLSWFLARRVSRPITDLACFCGGGRARQLRRGRAADRIRRGTEHLVAVVPGHGRQPCDHRRGAHTDAFRSVA